MELQVLVVPDCPNERAAIAALREAADRAGLHQEQIALVVAGTTEQGQAHGFGGSPTFALDGRDLFPTEAATGLSCRLYPTPDGPRGMPDVEDLTAALVRACADRARAAADPAAGARADRD